MLDALATVVADELVVLIQHARLIMHRGGDRKLRRGDGRRGFQPDQRRLCRPSLMGVKGQQRRRNQVVPSILTIAVHALGRPAL